MKNRLEKREKEIRKRIEQVSDPTEWLIESLILREVNIIGLEEKIAYYQQTIRNMEGKK
jgi:predicted  nucleic acid-binding Zn-ribbon protein